MELLRRSMSTAASNKNHQIYLFPSATLSDPHHARLQTFAPQNRTMYFSLPWNQNSPHSTRCTLPVRLISTFFGRVEFLEPTNTDPGSSAYTKIYRLQEHRLSTWFDFNFGAARGDFRAARMALVSVGNGFQGSTTSRMHTHPPCVAVPQGEQS